MRGMAWVVALLAAACSRDGGGDVKSIAERPAVVATAETGAGAAELATVAPELAAVAPELASAQAVALDGFQVTADRPVRVDGEVIARFIDAVRGDETMVMWVDAAYSRAPGSRRAVPNGRRIGLSGVVDLYRPGPIPGGYHVIDVRTAGMRHPLLVVRIETAEDVSDEQDLDGSGRATGIRVTETLELFDPRANRSVFRHEVRLASGDGFGGFDVGGLAIEVSGESVRLTGTRQGRLSAARARCLRPPPIALEFEWTGSRFSERSRGGPTSLARDRGC
jgi:hypothetical protein